MIKGKFSNIIFRNETNFFTVALFKLLETDESKLKDKINKTIHVTGIIPDIKLDIKYILTGSYDKHPKYSWGYNINGYELIKPNTKEDVIEFLASPFIASCGKKYAQKIVDTLGAKAIDIIRDDFKSLLMVPGMQEKRALHIYNSLLEYEKDDRVIFDLKNIGFSFEDAAKIISKHNYHIEEVIKGNLYLLKDLFDFKKIDTLYVNNFDKNSSLRKKECVLDSMVQLSFSEGSTYYLFEDIFKVLNSMYSLTLSMEEFNDYINELIHEGEVIKENKFYFLKKYYDEEVFVARKLFQMNNKTSKKVKGVKEKIEDIQKHDNITYNEEQKKAIKTALNNNISIISGGPGTGKTTIIKAICKIYMEENNLNVDNAKNEIALLAPTGRAAKKMQSATGLFACTIHRLLCWHKDEDFFEYNEDNKINHKIVIVDESSMIDISLAKALLCALYDSTKLIFVGDIYQLPSVGPGYVLSDLINSDYFNYIPLNQIYRQSENSYIPFLAKDIKNKNIDEEFMYKRDDYNFLISSEENIVSKICSVVKIALEKGIKEDEMQVLVPLYKGINGIDNINKCLQSIYNPEHYLKNQIAYGDKIFRENDKVMMLVNDSEMGVYNGDIGKILSIYKNDKNQDTLNIDFEGTTAFFTRKDFKNLRHAYAISIHKSQGNEFENVIMPVCRNYFIMLYNKLLYTGVSRAKKTLTIIGDPKCFVGGIQNDYASNRKTMLNERLNRYFMTKD